MNDILVVLAVSFLFVSALLWRLTTVRWGGDTGRGGYVGLYQYLKDKYGISRALLTVLGIAAVIFFIIFVLRSLP